MRALALLLVLLLAGCAAPPAPAPATPPDAEPVTLTFEGEAPPGARLPEAPDVPRAEHAFDAGAEHGFVELNLTYDPLVADLDAVLVDPWGRGQCATVQRLPPKTCTAPIPRNLTDGGSWRALVGPATYGAPPGAAYRLDVVLHPPAHLVRGDATADVDPSIRFRVSDTGVDGFEPTLGVLADGTVLAKELWRTMRTRDEGRSWEDVTPPLARARQATSDPLLRADPWSGRVYASDLYVACSTLEWSDDAGDTWTSNPLGCGAPVNDHQKLAIGPSPLPAPAPPLLYYSWFSFAKAVWVARSLDGGLTFTSTLVQGPPDMMPLNTGPLEADAEGNVYVPLYLCDNEGWVGVAVSRDRGLTFEVVKVSDEPRPCEEHVELDPGIAIDAEGTVHLAFTRASGVLYAWSKDRGATWSEPVAVQQPGMRAWRNVDVVAGDAGRIAIVYRGNVDSAKPHDASDGWAAWRLYVAFVEDAAGDAPVVRTALVGGEGHVTQRGALCQRFLPVCPVGRNLGDFLDIQALPDGRVAVAYDAGCPEAGCETPADSRLSRGLVAFQEDGPRLFAGRAPWAS